MRLLVALLISALISSQAIAADFQLELRTKFSAVPLKNGAQDGVWFPTDDAEYLLKLRTDIAPHLVLMYNQQQRVSDSLQLQLNSYVTIAKLEHDATLQFSAQADATQKKLSECLTGGSHWYNNPAVWAAVGFIAGSAATVGIVHAVK